MVGAVPVVGLPGNPMSAFVQFTMMVTPLLVRLQGGTPQPPFEVVARLAGPVGSVAGREDYVPARLAHGETGPEAHPIAFKSNLIFKLVEANALIHVPAAPARLEAGAEVGVRLL
jgi:molybdopterin molybdotransferase